MFPDRRGIGGSPGPRGPGLLGRILAAAFTAAAVVLGLMFSVVVLAVALVVGAAVFGWLWWRMRRALRQAQQDPRFRQFQEQMQRGGQPRDGNIIEGEVIRGEWQDESDRRN